MGRLYEAIDERLEEWLLAQPVFFVATAPSDPAGHVNCSPKGNRGELAITGPRRVAYLDQTGSGVETIAHLKDNGRIVLMFCAFEGPPRIVRLHGSGQVHSLGSAGFEALAHSFAGRSGVGVRSIVEVELERISDSCGYGVPIMRFEAHRSTMDDWAARKGAEGIKSYWEEKNRLSVDGLPGLS